MKSFGLWYICSSTPHTSNTPLFEVHINFWSESLETVKNKNIPYLDFGIKIYNYKTIDKLVFQCPFLINEDEFEDLSDIIPKGETANIIFNEDCKITKTQGYNVIDTNNDKFLIIPISNNNISEMFNMCDEDDRTNIIINLKDFKSVILSKPELKGVDVAYIRFRIKSSNMKNNIFFDSEPINKSFDSAFSGTRILDFKINSKRNLSKKSMNNVVKDKAEFPTINKLHLLVMEPASYDVQSFSDDEVTCRELESDLWSDYLEDCIDTTKGHVLAYHWKKKKDSEGFKEFSCLVKVGYSRAKKTTITAYILMAMALGMASSFIITELLEVTVNRSNIIFVGCSIVLILLFFLSGICIGNKSGRHRK